MFSDNVRLWLGRHSHREAALRHEIEQNYVDDAFRRFWQAVSDQKLSFSSLGSALCYLRLCLHCAVMDTLRTYMRPNLESLTHYVDPHEQQVETDYACNELCEAI